MVASVPEEMTCDVHDRGRERYLHGTRPPTQRVLRRRLLRDPDANGRRTLRVGETAAPDLPEHAPELRLTFGDPAALWQTTASQRLVRRDRAVAPSGHGEHPASPGREAYSAAVNEDDESWGNDRSGWAPMGGWGAALGPGISG